MRFTTAGRHGTRPVLGLAGLGQRAVVPSCVVVAVFAACAPAVRYNAPSGLRQYQILIDRRDSLGRAVGQGLKKRGFRVRYAVQGGGPPTAYLLSFTMQDVEPGSLRWLYVRLADTRSGAIVAAVSAPLDSLGPTADARARAIVDSLTRRPLRPPASPP